MLETGTSCASTTMMELLSNSRGAGIETDIDFVIRPATECFSSETQNGAMQ
jgi:hypothetical protein